MKRQSKKKPPAMIQTGLGIRFGKKSLLEAALSHPSYRNENPPQKLEDFDRLEFFGDSVLNYVICRRLYQRFPQADEGMLSRLRSILVSRKVLGRVAHKLKLKKLIRVGHGLKEQPNFTSSKVLSDCLEAIFAAVYFDQGLARAERFILRHLGPYIDPRKLFRLDPNPKSTLQEFALKHWQKLPQYESQPRPNGIRTVVSISTRLRATVSAPSRRQGEEKAARLLLRRLRQRLASSRPRRGSSGKKLRKTL